MTPHVIERLVQRPGDVAQTPPLTAHRAIGICVARAAQDVWGLSLTVDNIAEEEGDVAALIAKLSDDLLIFSVTRDRGGDGIVAGNPDLVMAAMEALTTGRVSKTPQPARRITNTDAALIRPCFTQILQDLALTCAGSALDGWSADCTVGPRHDSVRAVDFALKTTDFKVLRIGVTDRTTDRKPEMIVALPRTDANPAQAPDGPDATWADRLSQTVLTAPLALDAVLGRLPMTLGQLTGMQVGTCVPLPGSGLDRVALTASDGSIVARGRLGQLDGQIAVRVDLTDRPARDRMSEFPRPGPSAMTSVERALRAAPTTDPVAKSA